MTEIDEQIVNIIKVYKAQNVKEFALNVKLDAEKSKSRTLLQEAINNVIDNVLPAENIMCWAPKIYSSYNAKEKTTYFHAMLYCKVKSN